MKHVFAVVLKAVVVGVILGTVFPALGPMKLNAAIFATLVLVMMGYPIVDLTVLELYGGRAALVADIILAVIVLGAVSTLLPTGVQSNLQAILVSAVLVGISEWPLHLYLKAHVLKQETS